MKSAIFEKSKTCALLIGLLVIATSAVAQKKVYAKDFDVVGSTTNDATPGIIEALKACKKNTASELIFEKGEYHFFPDEGVDRYCFVSNNDEGLKRVVFPIEQIKNLTIDGQGSRFVFHGFTNPFLIENSTNIKFKNFSVDCARPFHSEGIILASNENEMDLEIPEQYPYKIANNILVFTDGDAQKDERKTTVSKEVIYNYGSLLEFDTQKRETAFMVYDYYINSIPLTAKDLGGRKIRIFLDNIKGTVGNTMVFASGNRNYPAFILSDSRDIRFENVTINHAGGMGIIGQRVHNVTVESCKVVPSEGRMISTTADATHFTNCTGKIELSNCTFMNQMDDATNIHGIYVQIVEKLAPNEVLVRLKHLQQLGFDFLKKGTEVELIQGKSLITKGTAKVVSAERINKELTKVKLSTDLPLGIELGDAIGELQAFAEVHIHGNYIGKNRARGMLLNCRGKTIVENNTFHSPGAAILFEGDASYWFEQGGVSDCTIRNNVFDNCLFGVWGKAIIDVAAGILENKEESRYNKNIKIYNNTFKIFDNPLLLHAYGMDNMKWYNNKIERTEAYPKTHDNSSLFKIENCDNMDIDQP